MPDGAGQEFAKAMRFYSNEPLFYRTVAPELLGRSIRFDSIQVDSIHALGVSVPTRTNSITEYLKEHGVTVPMTYHSECSSDNSKYFVIMEDLRLRVPAVIAGDEVRVLCLRWCQSIDHSITHG